MLLERHVKPLLFGTPQPLYQSRRGEGILWRTTAVSALLSVSSPRAVQGAGAILPGLNTTDRSQERTHADLAEAYRDTDDGDGSAGKPQTVCNTSEGGGEEEDWEFANDRMEACLRGGVSLTSLDVSSPRITIEFIKR